MSDEKVTPIWPGAYDPDIVGPEVVIAPDSILESAKGHAERIVIVYLDHEGAPIVAGSHSVQESHLLLHLGMIEIVKMVSK